MLCFVWSWFFLWSPASFLHSLWLFKASYHDWYHRHFHVPNLFSSQARSWNLSSFSVCISMKIFTVPWLLLFFSYFVSFFVFCFVLIFLFVFVFYFCLFFYFYFFHILLSVTPRKPLHVQLKFFATDDKVNCTIFKRGYYYYYYYTPSKFFAPVIADDL